MINNESIRKKIEEYLNNWKNKTKVSNEERKWNIDEKNEIQLSIKFDLDAKGNHIEKPLEKTCRIVSYNFADSDANPDENLHNIKKVIDKLEDEFKVQFGSLEE